MKAVAGACVALALGACAAAPPVVPPPAPAVVAPVPPPEPTTITIAAVGDIMLGTDFPKNVLPDDDGVGFLAHVTPQLSAADIAFGNFEGTLLDGGEPVKECKSSACYLFRTPTRYAAYLRDAGFDVMSLANNHARDFGEIGRESSMRALDSVGIRHSGREGTVAEWAVEGVRIGFIAFAPNVGANPLLDVGIALGDVRELAARNDIVIVSMHAGAEGAGAEILPFTREIYVGEDRGDVVAFARAAVDAGADLVLGHGPHVPRAMELHGERLIAYSLGNFATYYGIGVEGNRGIAPILHVTLDGEGRFRGGRIESTIQIRPNGPSIDPERRALQLLRSLTGQAFPEGELVIDAEGGLRAR